MGSVLSKIFAPLLAAAALYMVPWLIKAVLFTLGLGVVSFIGIDYIFDYGMNVVSSNYSGLPADIAAWVDYLGVPDALNILFSAISASLTLKLLLNSTSGQKESKNISFVK